MTSSARDRRLQAVSAGYQDDEQEAFDNMPESLMESERGEAMEEAIGNMEEAASMIDSIMSLIEDAAA